MDGDSIVVALREHGPHAWAHLRDGVVYGGYLGEGPAIEWTSRLAPQSGSRCRARS